MTDLSIIIPIYNTPIRDLRRCFASIAAPQDAVWEVLLIDDGSKEQVGQFCQAYAQSHPGFRYFYKENGGVSSARNAGIAQSQGRYIAFVDADDCLNSKAFDTGLLRQDYDLVLFDMDIIQGRKKSLWKALELPEGSVSRLDVLHRYLTGHSLNGPTAKLFRTRLLQDMQLRFDEGFVTAEDWLFGCSFATQAERICYIPAAAYTYYRNGSNSLARLRRAPDTMVDNLIQVYKKKLRIIQTEFADGQDALKVQAAVWITETLFNCTADLYLLKLYTPDHRTKIRQVCEYAKRQLTAASQKTRIKSWVLLHLPIAIYPIALLRRLYLKLK